MKPENQDPTQKIPTVDLTPPSPPTQPPVVEPEVSKPSVVEVPAEEGDDSNSGVFYTDQVYLDADSDDPELVELSLVATMGEQVNEVVAPLSPDDLRELRREINRVLKNQAAVVRLREKSEMSRTQRLGSLAVDPGGLRSRMDGLGENAVIYLFIGFIALSAVLMAVGRLF